MKLVHSMPHPVLMTDPRSLQILIGILTVVCVLLSVLYLVHEARPAVERIFAAMTPSAF